MHPLHTPIVFPPFLFVLEQFDVREGNPIDHSFFQLLTQLLHGLSLPLLELYVSLQLSVQDYLLQRPKDELNHGSLLYLHVMHEAGTSSHSVLDYIVIDDAFNPCELHP